MTAATHAFVTITRAEWRRGVLCELAFRSSAVKFRRCRRMALHLSRAWADLCERYP